MLNSRSPIHTSYLSLLLVSVLIPASEVLAINESQIPTPRCETLRDDGKHMHKTEQSRPGAVTSSTYICLCGDWYPSQQIREERLCGKVMTSAKEFIVNEKVIVPDGPDRGKCVVTAHKTTYEYRAVTLCENSTPTGNSTTIPSYPYPTPAAVHTPTSVPTRCELEETLVEPIYEWITVEEYRGQKKVIPILTPEFQITVKTPIGIPRSDVGRCDVRWKKTVFEGEEA